MKPLAFLLIPLLLAACVSATKWYASATKGYASPLPVASPSVSPSLAPSPSPAPTLTSTPPPAATATPTPIQGTLAIKVNVRSGPGTAFASLGLLDAGEKVDITVKDNTGAWYRILYPNAPGGSGWVAAQFVQVAAGAVVPLEATPTPAGPTGRVLQRLNVRSGPGLSFDSLGILEADALVSLTGKNSTAAWFQIVYPAGPGGHAWGSAQYIQTDASDLPVLDDFGTPVASAAQATAIPMTSTPTVGPAYADGDSAANPGVRVTFSASGINRFSYSSQVSAPEGDPEDWIEFTPYAVNAGTARLVFSLACSGNSALTVEIRQGGAPLAGWGSLACGDVDKLINLPARQALQMRLAPAAGAGLRLVGYVLTVVNLP